MGRDTFHGWPGHCQCVTYFRDSCVVPVDICVLRKGICTIVSGSGAGIGKCIGFWGGTFE